MQRSLSFAFILIVLAFITGPLSADQVDSYAQSQLKRQNLPGLSLAVMRNGKVLKAKGYGLANIELGARATERTLYQWASITKQFTAVAILLLAEEGKLCLEDRISRYLTNAPSAWSNVTVRHLLTHTSGIKSYTSLSGFMKNLRKDYEPAELIGLVSELPLEFSPGEKFSYNNTGYFLLGLIIEKVSGQTYRDFLAERIFQPLGMETARVNHQFQLFSNRAAGYSRVSNQLFNAEFVSPTQPFAAGALIGSVLDLAKWDAALYTDKLLSAATREQMWTPVSLNNGKTQPYGFGWTMGELRGHYYVAHGGGIHGFSTYIARFVHDKLTVIVLMNGSGDPQAVAHGVAGRYLPGLLLASIKPKADPHPELTQKLRRCLSDLAERRDSDLITPEFRENYSRSRGRAESLKNRLKELKSFTFVTEDRPSAYHSERLGVPVSRLCCYKMTTAQEARFYTFELTSDDRVAWYQSSEQ